MMAKANECLLELTSLIFKYEATPSTKINCSSTVPGQGVMIGPPRGTARAIAAARGRRGRGRSFGYRRSSSVALDCKGAQDQG